LIQYHTAAHKAQGAGYSSLGQSPRGGLSQISHRSHLGGGGGYDHSTQSSSSRSSSPALKPTTGPLSMGLGLNSGGAGSGRGFPGSLTPQAPLTGHLHTGGTSVTSGGGSSVYSVQTTGTSFADMAAAAAETSGCCLNGRSVEELLRDGGVLLRVLAHR
jgi:hypothetical protein